MQVDSEAISGWAGWEHAGDDHVAGPLDIVRRSDGHDVLLPWCAERVSSFFGRRAAADIPLAPGEMTTLAASLLRGLGELARGTGRHEQGEWWLTDDGRPTFVIGAGAPARAAAAGLVARMRTDSTDRTLARLLLVIEEGLSADAARPGVPALQLEKWEAELFDTAASKPLKRDVHAPELAKDADAARRAVLVRPGARRQLRTRASLARESNSAGALVSRIVGSLGGRLGDWRTAILSGFERTRRRSPDRRSVRRAEQPGAGAQGPSRRVRRTVIAVAAAAVVLAGGLLWPGGATGEPDSDGGTVVVTGSPRTAESDPDSVDPSSDPASPGSASSAPEPTPTSSGTGSPHGGAGPEDPVDAARALINAIDACRVKEDSVCDVAVAKGSVGVVDALDESDGALQFEPVDEYGDIAVVRLSSSAAGDDGQASSGGDRMVVLVRTAEKWLVRDVYDVADQPG